MKKLSNEELLQLSSEIEEELLPAYRKIDEVALYNTNKVLKSFIGNRVSDNCFSGSTGYGYDDYGRETIEKIYSEVFGAEAALVRTGFVNGTHAIATAIFAAVNPGEILLSVTGLPYDTLRRTIGIGSSEYGSLKYYGIGYSQVDLKGGNIDYDSIEKEIKNRKISAVFLQRSRGYEDRRALTVNEISAVCAFVKDRRPDIRIIVDNCYGEFTEKEEPTSAGADIMAGSLIKNPGGGLAVGGAYIAGTKELIDRAAARMTCPGIGGECGTTYGTSRMIYQGFFTAPHTVAQALKTACFCAALCEKAEIDTSPASSSERSDVIQMINFGNRAAMEAFCRGIQSGSPVDSYAVPVGSPMPGYDCDVIMAAGTFIQGSTSELSADGRLQEPYTVYVQGGLTYEAGKLGILSAFRELMK